MNIDRRRELRSRYISSMRAVSSVSRDQEAQAVTDFFSSNSLLAVPQREGRYVAVDTPIAQTNFLLLPLVEGDKLLGPEWANELRTNGHASYRTRRRLMISTEGEMTPQWEGVLFIHEGLHALEHITNPYDAEDRSVYLAREVSAFNLENRLVKQLGGQKYVDYLNSTVQTFRKSMSANGQKPGFDFPAQPTEMFGELENVFGKSQSLDEMDLRNIQFWMHINFELIEGYFRGDPEGQKVRFFDRNSYGV